MEYKTITIYPLKPLFKVINWFKSRRRNRTTGGKVYPLEPWPEPPPPQGYGIPPTGGSNVTRPQGGPPRQRPRPRSLNEVAIGVSDGQGNVVARGITNVSGTVDWASACSGTYEWRTPTNTTDSTSAIVNPPPEKVPYDPDAVFNLLDDDCVPYQKPAPELTPDETYEVEDSSAGVITLDFPPTQTYTT